MKQLNLIKEIFSEGFTGFMDNAGESEKNLQEAETEFYVFMASAPEMLDALKMVKDAWENNEVNFECNESNGTGYVGTHHLIKKALDAIAKAEGGQS